MTRQTNAWVNYENPACFFSTNPEKFRIFTTNFFLKFMKSLSLKLLSAVLWIWLLVSCILLTPELLLIWTVTFLFDRRLVVLHKFSCFWGAQYIWMNPMWHLRIIDRKKFDDTRAWIVISNHQSFVDILVINSLFKHFKWTSKAENFKLPFVGWVLTLNQSIKVFRTSRDAYTKFRKQAVHTLNTGSSLMVFPEGTRSRDGNLGRFKEGAFMLAHETHTGILPMVLDGSARAVPKKGWSLTGRARMTLKVLDPVPYEDFSELSPVGTAAKFREIIEEELLKIRS